MIIHKTVNCGLCHKGGIGIYNMSTVSDRHSESEHFHGCSKSDDTKALKPWEMFSGHSLSNIRDDCTVTNCRK